MRRQIKKAELLPENTVKLVMAVLGFLVLIVLLVKLYDISTQKTKVEQAKSTLNSLYSKIDALSKSSELNIEEISFLESPNKWALVYIKDGDYLYESGKDSTNYAFRMTNIFASESCKINCLCICEEFQESTTSQSGYNSIIKRINCKESGVCKEVSGFQLNDELQNGISVGVNTIKIIKQDKLIKIEANEK
jgi:hypothetical protein